jgi:hypothetical protein
MRVNHETLQEYAHLLFLYVCPRVSNWRSVERILIPGSLLKFKIRQSNGHYVKVVGQNNGNSTDTIHIPLLT